MPIQKKSGNLLNASDMFLLKGKDFLNYTKLECKFYDWLGFAYSLTKLSDWFS